MNDSPKRKGIRLKEYDYSQPGYYFVTLCTRDREMLLWDGGRPMAAPTQALSKAGEVVRDGLERIVDVYKAVRVAQYCIMPNHIHVIVVIEDVGAASGRPGLAQIINQFKGYTTRQSGIRLWQKGYYDRIIRSETEYLDTWRYIDQNPLQWAEDEYHPGSV